MNKDFNFSAAKSLPKKSHGRDFLEIFNIFNLPN